MQGSNTSGQRSPRREDWPGKGVPGAICYIRVTVKKQRRRRRRKKRQSPGDLTGLLCRSIWSLGLSGILVLGIPGGLFVPQPPLKSFSSMLALTRSKFYLELQLLMLVWYVSHLILFQFFLFIQLKKNTRPLSRLSKLCHPIWFLIARFEFNGIFIHMEKNESNQN